MSKVKFKMPHPSTYIDNVLMGAIEECNSVEETKVNLSKRELEYLLNCVQLEKEDCNESRWESGKGN